MHVCMIKHRHDVSFFHMNSSKVSMMVGQYCSCEKVSFLAKLVVISYCDYLKMED